MSSNLTYIKLYHKIIKSEMVTREDFCCLSELAWNDHYNCMF